MIININGSEIEVLKIRYDKSKKNSEELYDDCYITFLDGKEKRYDSCDITVL